MYKWHYWLAQPYTPPGDAQVQYKYIRWPAELVTLPPFTYQNLQSTKISYCISAKEKNSRGTTTSRQSLRYTRRSKDREVLAPYMNLALENRPLSSILAHPEASFQKSYQVPPQERIFHYFKFSFNQNRETNEKAIRKDFFYLLVFLSINQKSEKHPNNKAKRGPLAPPSIN